MILVDNQKNIDLKAAPKRAAFLFSRHDKNLDSTIIRDIRFLRKKP